jgi:hypothetical protein
MKVFKNSRSACTSTVSAILAVIGLILFYVLSKDGVDTAEANYVIPLLGAGIAIQAISILLYPLFKKAPFLLTLLGFVQTAAYALALMLFVMARISWLFMLLSKMSSVAMTALFPITIAVMALALIIQVISAFMTYDKTEK